MAKNNQKPTKSSNTNKKLPQDTKKSDKGPLFAFNESTRQVPAASGSVNMKVHAPENSCLR